LARFALNALPKWHTTPVLSALPHRRLNGIIAQHLQKGYYMNKLPQVFLILTALGLGIIYGHYEWKLDRQKEEQDDFYERWAKCLKEGDGIVDDTNNWYGMSGPNEIIKFRDRSGIGQHFYGDVTSQKNPPDYEEVLEDKHDAQLKEKERKKQDSREKTVKAPSYQKELDRIDFLMEVASTYLNIATIDVNLRGEYAKSAFDCTSKALDIHGSFTEEIQERQEVQQRLKAITEVRHAAMKLAPIEK